MTKTPTLLDLARRADKERAVDAKLLIGDEIEARLQPAERDALDARYSALVKDDPQHPNPTETALRALGLIREPEASPHAPAESDPLADVRALTLAAASARLANEVYAATALLERLQSAGLLSGNGHHARQKAAAAAVEELRARWLGAKHPDFAASLDGLAGARDKATSEPGATLAPQTAQEAPPATSEEERLATATAAYKRWRTLAQRSDVNEKDLAESSAAWTAARDLLPRGSEAMRRLEKAIARIDAELLEAKRRPLRNPGQLPSAIPVPAKK